MRTHAVLSRGRSPSEIVEVEIADPEPDEVVVQVEAVGLCHTDLVTRDLLADRPAVLGHEGCGRVVATGSAVRGLAVGERVVMSFARCGRCERCRSGQPAYCDDSVRLNSAGVRPDGSATIRHEGQPVFGAFFGQSSWAGLALTRASSCVPVGDVPAHVAAPLGCSGLTGAGAVLSVLRPRRGDRLLVVGGGGVGATAALTALGEGVEVVVAEPVAARRAVLEGVGATTVASVGEVVGEVSHALDTTGRPDVIALALGTLERHGALCLVGLGAAEAALDVRRILRRGLTVRGSLEGDADPGDLVPELLGRWREGRLPLERIVSTYPLTDIDEAIAQQRDGHVLKVVLEPHQM